MNKYQKETIKMSLEEEKKVLNSLTSEYKEAKKAVKAKLKTLMERTDADLPHVIHQIKYQKAIESQLDEALEKLKSGEYKTIADYMEDSYGTGFTSSLYRLQKQGVPLLFPMDKNEIIRAVQTNSKISGGLYKRLGINARAMKNAIRQEITRGISSSMSYGDIARNLDNRMNSGLYNSYRIARTEGHRINQEASYDAMNKAKEAGADIVKQWDSTLDGRTRPHHRDLNGQIRELDDPFEVAGLSAMYPSGFGKASEDINCRCVVLEIGRWELDEEDTFTKFDGNEGVIVSDLSNVKNYEEFRKKYNIEVKKKEAEFKVEIKVPEFVPAKTIQEAQDFASQFCDDSVGFGAIGVDFTGIHIDVANELNKTLNTFYNTFDVGKLGGIASPAKNTKLGKMVNSHLAYSPIRKSLLFNRDTSKDPKKMLKALMADKDAIDDILSHPEKYSFSKMSKRVLNVVENSKVSGRGLVPTSIGESITHELGHFMESFISKEELEVIKSGMAQYSKNVSGYATDSVNEYIAESFTSYMKGEDKIDPAVRKIFDGKRKRNG